MKISHDRRRTRRRTQSAVDVFVTVAILVAVGVVIWRNWPPPPPPPIPLPAEPIAVHGAATKGNPGAPMVLMEYSDFECPYCGSFARDTLPNIDRQYFATGKVLFVYRHITPPTHRRAVPAAVAANCAGRQGKYWEMHDRLYANQTELDDASLSAHASAVGIDAAAFKACQADPAIADEIARDTAEARRLRISGTPAFFVGEMQPDGRVKVTGSLRGAVPLADLQTVLDAQLGEGLLARLFSLGYPIGLAAGAAAALGLVGSVSWARRRRARTFNEDRCRESGAGGESPVSR
jgi:protein-disulfide isomerase